MTKRAYDADFWIYVRPETWDVEGPESQFFAGIYTARLNSFVEISFVPDVSDACPPWIPELVPNGGDVSSEREARVFQALMTAHSVTPNAQLAGQEEIVELQRGEVPPRHGVVWYVAPDDWPPLTDELENLTQRAYSEVHSVRFSQISDTRLAGFLEERFLPSGKLSARDLSILRRA
jgi:hypothetical protein